MLKILAAFHLDSPDSLKRAITAVLSGAVTLLVNPLLVSKGYPPVSDVALMTFAGIVSAFLLQSGASAVARTVANAQAAGAAAAAQVTPGPAADAVVDAAAKVVTP